MSWGEYITNLQGQGLKNAVLAGQDGSWIQSSDTAVSFISFTPRPNQAVGLIQ